MRNHFVCQKTIFEEKMHKNKFVFEISYLTIMKNICCSKCITRNEKEKLDHLGYADYYIDRKLDLSYYLKLMTNFEYLLKILLTDHQKLLFNFTKKPRLKTNKKDKISKLFNETNFKVIVDFLKRTDMKTKNIKDDKDYKILKFLNPFIVEYFRKI